jgi:hypothetical protein
LQPEVDAASASAVHPATSIVQDRQRPPSTGRTGVQKAIASREVIRIHHSIAHAAAAVFAVGSWRLESPTSLR